MRILLVEDQAELAHLIAANLRRSGFAVDVVGLVADAREAVETTQYRIVLLDLRLPDGDGFDIIRSMRRRHDPTPIVVLTARDRLADRVEGLNLGADDYLVKPFAHEELLARVQAVLRRPRGLQDKELCLANLRLATESGEVTVGEERLAVPRRELAVMRMLMRRAGHMVSREALENGIYDSSQEIESNALEAAISRLRKRLAAAGAEIEILGLRGSGYMMRAKPK
jgi:two-component system OmpR family response regulator